VWLITFKLGFSHDDLPRLRRNQLKKTALR